MLVNYDIAINSLQWYNVYTYLVSYSKCNGDHYKYDNIMKNSRGTFLPEIDEFEGHAILLIDNKGYLKTRDIRNGQTNNDSPDVITEKNFRVFYTEEDQENGLPEKLINDATENGCAIYDGWSVNKSGAKFWSNTIITALYNKGGGLTGFSKVTRKVTIKKQPDETDEENKDKSILSQLKDESKKPDADLAGKNEKEKRADVLNSVKKELVFQNEEKGKRAAELIIANKELAFLNSEKEKRAEELVIAYKELALKDDEKEKRAEELSIANKELVYQDEEKEKRAAELIIANKELVYQNKEKEKRAAELIIANKELAFQNDEKEKRAAELIIANKELVFQNDEKEKRAAELIIANKELVFQNEEKENRAAELIIANKELVFQNDEKEKRAAELIIANKELVFQNDEKEKRAAELINANKELAYQNEEKEKRAAELINANRLYAFLSQINQTIVHSKNEQIIFKETCRIAVDYGKFKVAWFCTIDTTNKRLILNEACGMEHADIIRLTKTSYRPADAVGIAIQTGKCFVCNDIEHDPAMFKWKLLASERNWQSCMVLPIRKSGIVASIFTIVSSERNFFNSQEIDLLDEASGDISFALDVFEKEKHREEMEAKVIHSELSLKQAQSISHFGNWELDFISGNAEWSEEACRIYGFDPCNEQQSNESWESYIHPEDREHAVKLIKEGRDTLSSFSFQHRIVRKDRTIRHIDFQARYKFNSDGHPTGINCVAHDITEIKEVENSLAQSESNLRQIMDLIPQSIFAKDYKGKFVFVNKSFAALYGYTPNELINKSANGTIPANNDTDQYQQEDCDVIVTGKSKIIPEVNFTDHNGNKHLFHIVKVPFTVAGTHERAVLGIILDITEQKQAETERTKMVADIVQRNNNLEQFSYIVSHNLRAPVANILGLTNVIETIGLDKDEENKVIGHISKAAKNLDTVIRDINYILELKHEVSEKKQRVQFSHLLDEIKSGIGSIIKEDHVSIISDFSATDEILTIKSYLHSIFYNLISNSIKYRQNDIAPVIEITSAILKNKIQLTFKDNGLGINMKRKGKEVFGLYKRFHDHVEGKGMGLFMVKTQVETLGGTITIASEVNKGTEFTIEFEINT